MSESGSGQQERGVLNILREAVDYFGLDQLVDVVLCLMVHQRPNVGLEEEQLGRASGSIVRHGSSCV